MNRKPWPILVGIILVLLLAAAALWWRPRPAAPTVTLAPALTLSPTPSPVYRLPSREDSRSVYPSLPTVTPPAPGEPTVPAEALAMRAAPTATPGAPPTLTPLPTPIATFTLIPTPTPVLSSGHDDVLMIDIPAGEFIMGSASNDADQRGWECVTSTHNSANCTFPDESPQLIVNLPAFKIDQVPVTNARYQTCVQAQVCNPVPAISSASGIPEDYAQNATYNDYPVRNLTWYDAVTYCGWVGKRLPTEEEWEKAARGTEGISYPWGNTWNAEYLTPQFSAVGTHISGASPYGVLDMLSETGEWTSTPYHIYPGNYDYRLPVRSDVPYNTASSFVVRGRSILASYYHWVTARSIASPGREYPATFRCVQGQTPPPTLDESLVHINLPTMPSPADTVDLTEMVYIPEGAFVMGYNEPYIDSRGNNERANAMPAHSVYLDAFYIDRYEVTYTEYVNFLNTLGGNELSCNGFNCARVRRPDASSSFADIHILVEDGRYSPEPGYEKLPADHVSWYGATAYCAWVGKRLPTEAEWEKAARGTDARLFPWGNQWDPRGATEDVHIPGSQAINVSPYGVYDMLGNRVEWVADWYAEDYYFFSPFYNPTGPSAGEDRVLRSLGGGPDLSGQPRFGLPSRLWETPNSSLGGFRCAYTPGQD